MLFSARSGHLPSACNSRSADSQRREQPPPRGGPPVVANQVGPRHRNQARPASVVGEPRRLYSKLRRTSPEEAREVPCRRSINTTLSPPPPRRSCDRESNGRVGKAAFSRPSTWPS